MHLEPALHFPSSDADVTIDVIMEAKAMKGSVVVMEHLPMM
jgi:hypothetical protein